MKLCKDCKHFRPDTFFSEAIKNAKYGKCSKDKASVDPVTGEYREGESYASVQRSLPLLLAFIARECGSSGRYFEPKE